MKLFIPPLGTKLVLAEDWTFDVYDEYRNITLMAMLPKAQTLDELKEGAYWRRTGKKLGTFTFPKGTRLTVDRIYIRQGSADFDSVSFRAPGFTAYRPTGLKGKTASTKVPFWAKLADVNRMEVETPES